MKPKDLKQRRPHSGRWAANEVAAAVAKSRSKNCQRKSRKPAECFRLSACEIVLDSLTECPILSHAARKAGIHRKTLEYWIKRSEAGDDGYDIEWQGVNGDFTNTANQR